ncbi:MAG: nitroreductase family deazaflavin-dependent oxidoreductase [Thermomicrobiales bacterium]|nr:nitroreductase family deazaflavin-dependent oxidoreductase [Thermomicrobiales bacterium]
MATNQPTFDRGRPNALRKWFFRLPVPLYRGPVGKMMSKRCVMMLTTIGRTSGLPRTSGVSFMPVGDSYIVFAGWGIQSDWYKNLLANPDVTVQIGGKRFKATARLVDDPARRKDLMLQMRNRSGECGPPDPVRSFLKSAGLFDYEGELEMAVEQADQLPVVEITPISGAPSPG